jgi:large subunit ribosomal protein L3
MTKINQIIGKKVGMTRVFAQDGESIPVSVIQISDNVVCQVRAVGVDGYDAVQLASVDAKKSRVGKSQLGHFAVSGTKPKRFMLESSFEGEVALGQTFGVSSFEVGSFVDVSGRTLGKGFAGTIKRHNFSSGRATHGNSKSHNVPGSISMAQDPGRVFPGKRMSGHMGDVRCTVQNLQVIKVDLDRGLLFVKGAIPGSESSVVFVKRAVKK